VIFSLVNTLPDSLWLRDCEVEEHRAGRLHAGIPGGRHPTFPLKAGPAARQEVHQQGRGVEREQHLPGTFFRGQVTQSREEVPRGGGVSEIKMLSEEYRGLIPSRKRISSLPQRFSARPRRALLSWGRLRHPAREALLGALALQVAPGVVDQERQQLGHLLLQAGSLLGEPRAQRAERGEDERVTVATRVHLQRTGRRYRLAEERNAQTHKSFPVGGRLWVSGQQVRLSIRGMGVQSPPWLMCP